MNNGDVVIAAWDHSLNLEWSAVLTIIGREYGWHGWRGYAVHNLLTRICLKWTPRRHPLLDVGESYSWREYDWHRHTSPMRATAQPSLMNVSNQTIMNTTGMHSMNHSMDNSIGGAMDDSVDNAGGHGMDHSTVYLQAQSIFLARFAITIRYVPESLTTYVLRPVWMSPPQKLRRSLTMTSIRIQLSRNGQPDHEFGWSGGTF
jgi:hypothetical protein